MIELNNIRKKFNRGFIPKPVEILKGITLSVQRGEVFGYLGPNGAGKTTTIKVLMNLLIADGGSATINRIDVLNPAARTGIGFLPEQPYYYGYLTGKEFLDYCGRLFSMPYSERIARIRLLLGQVGLEKAAEKRLGTYSRGMLQRIGIAQALLNNPDILVLDEPLSGLDPEGRKDILEILLVQKESKKTIFFSTHILSDTEILCDTIGIINNGKIISSGKIQDILARNTEKVLISIVVQSEQEPTKEMFSYKGEIEFDSLPNQRYHVMIHEAEYTNQMITELIEHGYTIESVNRKSQSLEDIYLKLLRSDETDN